MLVIMLSFEEVDGKSFVMMESMAKVPSLWQNRFQN